MHADRNALIDQLVRSFDGMTVQARRWALREVRVPVGLLTFRGHLETLTDAQLGKVARIFEIDGSLVP